MNDVERAITEMFLTQFKDTIRENQNYDEYISSFTKKQLERLLKINAVIDSDTSKLAHVLSISFHKKYIVIEEFINQAKEIYTKVLKNVDESILQQFEIFLKQYDNNVLELDLQNFKYSLHFIEILNVNCIAHVKYLSKEQKLYLFTPIEIRNILKEILKDKNLKKENKKTSICVKNIFNLIATYGVISIKELNEIYNQIYGKMEEQTLIKQLLINELFDDKIKLIHTDDGYLAYGIEFEDEDEVLGFFYSLPSDLDYKIYTKDEYSQIGEGTYHHNFNEFENLLDFLELNFNMSKEEIYHFDGMFILDYIYSYQLNDNIAKGNLKSNLEKQYKLLNIHDKLFISKSILSIARCYPNFNYKGHSYNEVKDRYKEAVKKGA